MHPYEMRAVMQERGHDQVVRMRGGSLYDTVERLARAGLIEAQETSREGRRPERTIYAITEAGRDELTAWVAELIFEPVNDYPQFASGLAFILVLPQEQVSPLLTRRAAALAADVAATHSLIQSMLQAHLPRILLLEVEHKLAMREAELKWVRSLVQDIKEGSLVWPVWERFESDVVPRDKVP